MFIHFKNYQILASGQPPATPCSPFGFEKAFKEGKFWFGSKEAYKEERDIQGWKRHLRREEAFWEEIIDWDKQCIPGWKFFIWTNFQNFCLKFEI